jgi:hypothetical protein
LRKNKLLLLKLDDEVALRPAIATGYDSTARLVCGADKPRKGDMLTYSANLAERAVGHGGRP